MDILENIETDNKISDYQFRWNIKSRWFSIIYFYIKIKIRFFQDSIIEKIIKNYLSNKPVKIKN